MKIQLKNLSTEQQTQMINTFVETVGKNPYIPHKPFIQQFQFLTYPSEELLYGGQAGGGKSDCLLMAALQYVDQKNYSALLLRRTYQDLSQPNAIMDRAKKWLHPYTSTGEVHWNNQTKTFTFPSGATLSFGYLSHDNDLDQYQGSELQFVGFDELTQFTEKQYTYLHSRLRKTKNSNIPLRMRAGTNPGGRGHDWVKKRFINGPVPFIQSAYTDNIYLDTEEYKMSLEKLDELTKQWLMHGNWDAAITTGLLISLERLHDNIIQLDDTYEPTLSVIGIDPAGSGTDKFSMCCLTLFTNQKLVVTDLEATPTNQDIELRVRDFIQRNMKYNPVLINFEKEPGSASEQALNYWRGILKDLIPPNNIQNTPASSTGDKFTRATPHAHAVKEDKLFFNNKINENIHVNDYNPLNSLFNQYVYVHPSKEVMREYSSPDELDSLSYAYLGMDELLQNQTNIIVGTRIGA